MSKTASMVQYVLHTFAPGQTIDAVIKLKGRQNLTAEEMVPLRKSFNELNGAPIVRPGMELKIPLPDSSPEPLVRVQL
jgi:hypothetical protein